MNALKLLKNGAIIDAHGQIVVRLVYGGTQLNHFVLEALKHAPPSVLESKDKR